MSVDMIVKIFHEYLTQSRPSTLKEDLQKLEDKINTFAGQKGVVIHDIKYEKIQNGSEQCSTNQSTQRSYINNTANCHEY